MTLMLLASATSLASVAQAAERPNFVQILTDDQTIDSMRYMPRTRRLLKRQGTTFRNYNAVQPLCCPSRATLLSGQYPHNHGVLNNAPPYGYGALDWSRTLYTALDGAGYRTGWLGKVLNPTKPGEGVTPEPGFDVWLSPTADAESHGLDMFDYTLSDDGRIRHYRGRYQNTLFQKRALRFIRDSGAGPFILTVSVHSPHWAPCHGRAARRNRRGCPPQPAPRDRKLFRGIRFPFGPDWRGTAAQRRVVNRYWRREIQSMQSVDRLVGAVHSELKRRGELDDTYLIFQSDNGLEHGEHGAGFNKNQPWQRSVLVPLIIRGPGFAAGAKRDDLTANVDVPATILDAAGVAPPRPPDGYSLLSGHRRRDLLLERLVGSGHKPRSASDRAWRQIKTADGWTYWSTLGGRGRHLYNVRRDPYQVRNLARRRPGKAAELAARMESIADCAAPCP